MIYRELLQALGELTDTQLDCVVTVELSYEEECLPGELRICSDEHFALDDNHPVIFV